MGLFRNNMTVGLDIGQTSVKAVCLRRRGKAVEIVKREQLNTREEGILDELELLNTVGTWLREKGWSKAQISVGLPQYLATTQISDFAPGASGNELEQMVTYETRQLAGLSEESFISDYQVMEPDFGRQNPVLIGICRESVIRERDTLLENAGIHMQDLSMNGLAVANAFFHLHPDAIEVASPQLLIDIGTEGSTALVVAKGQVLFVGSLMVGSQRYTRGLAEKHGCSELEAEKLKKSAVLDQLDPECPLLLATRQLEGELRTAVDHWRASERPEISSKMFSKLWLSGGGARVGGLANYLSRTYGCEAEVFGPAAANEGETEAGPEPEMVTALGLALQGLAAGHINITLSPPELRWERQRLQRFGYLVAAACLAVALVGFIELRYYRKMEQTKARLNLQLAELNRCEQLVPKIATAKATIEYYEKMLIPFVEKGNRARRFLETIAALAKAKGENGWFIYLGDQYSFKAGGREPTRRGEAAPAPPQPAPNAPMFAAPHSLSSLNAEAPKPLLATANNVDNIPRLQYMVLAGFTPWQRRRYEPVQRIAKKLDDSPLFKGVDLLPQSDQAGRAKDLFQPWEKYLNEYRRSLGSFTSFMFRLPFAHTDVVLPQPSAGHSSAGHSSAHH